MTVDELLMLRHLMPDAKERRRYALLQAAATLEAGLGTKGFKPLKADDQAVALRDLVLTEAEALLAEIEKREKAEAGS